jgi:IS1 family transposase
MLRPCTSAPSATCTSRICRWTNDEPGCATPNRCVFLWLAIDPLTKILPVLYLGPRTHLSAQTVMHSLRQILSPGCVPLFTSDGFNVYFSALTAHVGHWLQVGYRGRKALRWQVAAELISGQVKKSSQRRKLVRVTHVMRRGTETALEAALLGLGLTGRLNTAFLERGKLTVRHGVAALARRSWATAKPAPQLLVHLEWWRGSSHGCLVLTHHCACRSCSHASEVANVWRHALGSVRQPWQRGEPPEGGLQGKCCVTPFHRPHASSGERIGSEKTPMKWQGSAR